MEQDISYLKKHRDPDEIKNSIESVHPFLRQNNWMHRNLIVAGNFNMTNVHELFDNLVQLGQHPKDMVDTVTVMEKIGHFLDDAVAKLYKRIKTYLQFALFFKKYLMTS